ncbi:MAG: Primosomal protein N' [Candidatus Uhrbacteria bacterium GW2011_GWE2_40_58]|nr:MAG: Primosomal protein N' [Candidatus Uhrbacteria bacterium GW2011_GWF2_40_263]KKR68083.1 MAG: Primosomal protein N' [Candidatus Uhrbacteria bacterium GW2011_GWE2_40_58]OGL91784.1 MAG: hypothetical protein A2239_04465 [Candidatus Uhrbacteria bacterium RIFOXYA2_FULL_40_9]OGL97234.1 MAG: hypothetical protein A2332_01440 [Candidatus Uhrbacteria bacterium RIFOXYB2_FULL_41_18]HBK34459.1 hypothetical protein [Candidatus Uhrbacteria bacterium]
MSQIAQIYPLKRMPRSIGMFDYDVPEGMSLLRGSVVKIPFRNSVIVGIVGSINTTPSSPYKRKEILSKLQTFHLSNKELIFFEELAMNLAQSVSSLLYTSLPTIPKRENTGTIRKESGSNTLTVRSSESHALVEIIDNLQKRKKAFVLCPDLRRSAAVIAASLQEDPERVVNVITPTVHDAELLAQALAHLQPFVITGAERQSVRYQTWLAWRSQKKGVLIGTRICALLTHPHLNTVFLVRSSHPQHKQQDRNPRFDTRQTTQLLSKLFECKLFFLDVLPRVDDLSLFARADILHPFENPPTQVVSLTQERPTAPHPMIGYTTYQHMEKTLTSGKRVVCIYNKKGVSRRLRCQDCQESILCPSCHGSLVVYEQSIHCHRCGYAQVIPSSCPHCKGKNVLQKGFGNRSIAKVLQNFFPNKSLCIIDKEKTIPNLEADILLVTNFYLETHFSPFSPPALGLVVQLDADLALYEPSYRSIENTMLALEDCRGFARACQASVIFQTESPDLIESLLQHPYEAHLAEQEMRRLYHHPPFRRFIQISYRSDDLEKNLQKLKSLEQQIKKILPSVSFQIKNQENQLRLDIGVDFSEEKRILEIFAQLEDQYIIDTSVS